MDDDLYGQIQSILDPEPDEEGETGYQDLPHPRLTSEHALDLSYLKTFNSEGRTDHPRTRLCPTDAESVHFLTRNSDVPVRLFRAALRLFGESVITYADVEQRVGPLRFYPPIILTFWSGFETFLRHSSELLLATTNNVPQAVANVLTESERFVDPKGRICDRTRFRPVLERYFLLLKYGQRYELNRGARFWQRLKAAQILRDYYTHLDVTKDPRSISTSEVVEFMESVLLGIIAPSAHVKRTQLLHVYDLYWDWDSLRKLGTEYVEQPLLKDMPVGRDRYFFYCPFDGVDSERFPNSKEDYARHHK